MELVQYLVELESGSVQGYVVVVLGQTGYVKVRSATGNTVRDYM